LVMFANPHVPADRIPASEAAAGSARKSRHLVCEARRARHCGVFPPLTR